MHEQEPLYPAVTPIMPAPPLDTAAVEIVGMLGDSVVAVKHVSDPNGGRVSRATYALAGASALALATSVVMFAIGVETAQRNVESKAAWNSERQRGVWKPERMGVGSDVLAVGGLVFGIIGIGIAGARWSRERVRPDFRIGSAADCDLPLAFGAESFPLVAPRGDGFVCNVGAGMDAVLWIANSERTLEELEASGLARPSPVLQGVREVAIPTDGRIVVTLGQTRLTVRQTSKARRQPAPVFAVEAAVLVALLASAAGHLGFLAFVGSVPGPHSTLSLDPFGTDLLSARFDFAPSESDLEERQEDSGDGGEAAAEAGGQKHVGADGAMGTRDSVRESGRASMAKRSDTPELARAQAMAHAQSAGMLGALSSNSSFSSFAGTADFSSGLDDADVFGGLDGTDIGEMRGGFGFGRKGMGPGADGTGWGTIGVGGHNLVALSGTKICDTPGCIGEICHGRDCPKVIGGIRRRRGHLSKVPPVRLGKATVQGLDKATVRRYIRRKLDTVAHCYERELVVKPHLEGTVTVNFKISPQGAVIGAVAGGMGDRKVESCVARAISTIQFPATGLRGLASVKYPFNFRHAGR